MIDEPIVNKVAQSGIITIDLEKYYPKGERKVFDLKPFLWQEMVLREKEYRDALKNYDWEQFRDTHVAITCSADAIVAVWAYMLAATYLTKVAKTVMYGTAEELENQLFIKSLEPISDEIEDGSKIVIKGCGKLPIPTAAFVEAINRLLPKAASVMYGEPCSTVPLYKKK